MAPGSLCVGGDWKLSGFAKAQPNLRSGNRCSAHGMTGGYFFVHQLETYDHAPVALSQAQPFHVRG